MVLLNRLSVFISSILLGVMALHMAIDALSSYFFNRPIDETIELVSRYYMIIIVYLSMAYVQSRDQHIVAEIFSDRFSVPFACLCQCLVQILFMGLGILLIWAGGDNAVRNMEINESVQTINGTLIVWPSRWIIVFSGILIVCQSCILLFQKIKNFYLLKNYR